MAKRYANFFFRASLRLKNTIEQTMAKTPCDNTSSGVLVYQGDDLLLIERKQYNFGFACPAGHNDGDEPRGGAFREVREEVGITLQAMERVLERRYDNPCGREGGDYHLWTLFESNDWSGDIELEDEEVLSYMWATPADVRALADRYEQFAKRMECELDDLVSMSEYINTDDQWRHDPGLEPVWYIMLKNLGRLGS